MSKGTLLLDFIRYQKHLKGTKIGCREGDCGACTVLTGELSDDELIYRSVTSCLTPLGNIEKKHVITIEGLNLDGLNPIQQAMCDEGGTQCGFCTPGFIVSMAGFCLSSKEPSYENAVASVDGNICRCTGYKSIERALKQVSNLLTERNEQNPLAFSVAAGILPAYLATIKHRLTALQASENGELDLQENADRRFASGGTDLYVQQHEAMTEASINFLSTRQELKGIFQEGNTCIIGAASTVSDLVDSPLIQKYLPDIRKFTKLVSSTPIRNMATLGGNFVNASPIGDFSIFFLALDAKIELSSAAGKREIQLKDFYKGYKQLNKTEDELVSKLFFELPDGYTYFNFEKVSKRTHLDIASVNTAISLQIKDSAISKVRLSAGGVGPTPLLLVKTSEFLQGKNLSGELVQDALAIAQIEIAPISDARGTETYKRLLLGQLIKAHFITLFPAVSNNLISI